MISKFPQPVALFCAAPEYERITALDAHHRFAAAGFGDQQLVDEGLRRAGAAAALAHMHDARAAAQVAQDARIDQIVD